jgi:glycosyltransferase involved in cell wall biosynthesis
MVVSASSLHLAVVIPCYNSQAWVGRTIYSVLEQGYPDLRLIVVDDGSTDGSAQQVLAFGDRVNLLTGPNRGPCHARNKGMRVAIEGEATHILFLDADDILEGQMLAGAARVASSSGADIVLSDMHRLDDQGVRHERFIYSGRVRPEQFFEGWMSARHFAPASILWKISFLEKVGGWDESITHADDTDICLRAMFHDPLIMKNDQGAALYVSINPNSLSRRESRRSVDSRLRVMAGLIRRAKGSPMEPSLPLLHARLHTIARTAFKIGEPDLGRQALLLLNQAGYREVPGTWQHRLITRLVGLETKVRIWGS